MQPKIRYPENIKGAYYSSSSTSLAQVRQGLINNGALQEHESVSSWFENKIATAGAPKDNPIDWKHLTQEQLEQMSPEEQKAFFKTMPSDGPQIIANLMKGMPIDEQVALLDNMSPQQMMNVINHINSKDQPELFSHMTPNEQKALVAIGIQKQIYLDITKSDAQTLNFLKELQEKSGLKSM